MEVELAKPNRNVAANDDRAPPVSTNDDLHAACVARRRDEPEPGKQLELAVDRRAARSGWPLGARPLRARPRELRQH